MKSSAEKFGRPWRTIKAAANVLNEGKADPVMYRTNLRGVPKVEGLKRDDNWVDMQVRFLIDKKSADADHVVGWTVLSPARGMRTTAIIAATSSSSCSKAAA